MKNLFAICLLAIALNSFAQLPSYVPTNGLVGYWPFTGNANDVSGNGNNGTVNGATLTTDRNGQMNDAYSFDGILNNIEVPHSNSFDFSSNLQTISFWMKVPQIPIPPCCPDVETIFGKFDTNFNGFAIQFAGQGQIFYSIRNTTSLWGDCPILNTQYIANQYIHILFTNDNDSLRAYVNGQLVNTTNIPNGTNIGSNTAPLLIGKETTSIPMAHYFNGQLDDIGIWNRVLNQQEIADVYNSVNCSNNTAISPQINTLQIGNTAIFTASTSDPNPSYVWQSDFGQGFQTLNNFGNYSGANTATFNISNVQLSEHNQPIRVISTSGNCIDTSNVALINITDTCVINVYDTLTTQVFDTTFVTQTVYDTLYVTVYDTLLTTVTDTLIINATLVGLNPPNNLNTLKIYPNPTSTHITIDYGNFIDMNGYLIKIVNSIGQTIFTTPINLQTSYIDLSTWTGNGVYFVQLIDPQNNTIENRKIVIQ
jgi:hypothetical protein